MILFIRTDKPEAEIGLVSDGKIIEHYKWHAHRELEASLLKEIRELLERHNSELQKLEGVIMFAGPGSFTGLRIGFAVTNALAYGLQIPNAKSAGDSWIETGIDELSKTNKAQILLPDYGGEPNITKPKK